MSIIEFRQKLYDTLNDLEALNNSKEFSGDDRKTANEKEKDVITEFLNMTSAYVNNGFK